MYPEHDGGSFLGGRGLGVLQWGTVCLWKALGAVPALKKERDELCDMRTDGPGLANKEVGAGWLEQPYWGGG